MSARKLSSEAVKIPGAGITGALLAAAGLLWLASTVIDRAFMAVCFTRMSCYVIAALFAVWASMLASRIQNHGKLLLDWCRTQSAGITVSILLSAAIFVSAAPYFRLLADETNLLAVSKSMMMNGGTGNTIEGFFQYFNFYPLQNVYEKRPFLFPFLVQLLHLVRGYQPTNPFVVNFMALTALFLILFTAARRRYGILTGIAAVFFVAAQPLTGQTAASAGFDLFFVLMFAVCMITLEHYLREPGKERFALFWIHLMLFANTRYEAPLLTAVIAVAVFMMRLAPLNVLRSSPLYGGSVFFFLPVIWQRMLTQSFETPPGVTPFSFAHFLRHQMEFFRCLFDFEFFMPYASIINLLGLVSLVWFLFSWIRRKWPQTAISGKLLTVAGAALGVQWIVTNAYFGDVLMDPGGGRVMLYAFAGLSLLAMLGLARLPLLRGRSLLLLMTGIFFFLIYHPVSMENRFLNAIDLSREYRMVLDFLARQNSDNLLVVCERPGIYTAQQYGAVKFEWANQHFEELRRRLRQRLYSEAFVVQEIDAATGVPKDTTLLNESYALEPVYTFQRQPDPLTYIRISRVILK